MAALFDTHICAADTIGAGTPAFTRGAGARMAGVNVLTPTALAGGSLR